VIVSVDAIVLFFILGIIIRLANVPFEFPKGLSQTLIMILLIAIGIKGGVALQTADISTIAWQSVFVVSLGVVLPLIAYPILSFFGGFDRLNAASIAAHYGSVSVGTYAVAVAVLDARGIAYEAYFPVFVVLLEIPAIIVGLLLAQKISSQQSVGRTCHELLLSPGIVFMVGGLLIGYFSGNSIENIEPFYKSLFSGILTLFLLEMGMVAASKTKDLKVVGAFITAFACFMPLVGAFIGSLTGFFLLKLSLGGTILLTVLAASASYIAVPAAMRIALPKANHGVSIAASLAVTFPFNVVVGIPLYAVFCQWLANNSHSII